MNKGKVIALVDHLSGGHHIGYIRLIAKALIELGHTVWVFSPGAESEVLPWLRKEGLKSSTKAFNLNIQCSTFRGFGRFAHAAETYLLWRDISHQLTQAEKFEKVKIDFVFFAWLDSFLANYLPHQLVDLIFKYRWSGLYFHPIYLIKEYSNVSSISSIDIVLKSKRCSSVFVQDEFLTDRLNKRINKAVYYFPQITDQTMPAKDFQLAKEIREQAGNRKAVGLIGLAKRKGLLGFINLIKTSSAELFYFFIAGPIDDAGYSAEELFSIQSFLKKLPSNCMYYPAYLNEGAEINAVIESLDIVYQVYSGFESASNFTTKAAYLKKPVLAQDSGWIGKTARKYNLGITVAENDSDAIAAGLLKLGTCKDEELLNPDNKEYLEKNNFLSLKATMAKAYQ